MGREEGEGGVGQNGAMGVWLWFGCPWLFATVSRWFGCFIHLLASGPTFRLADLGGGCMAVGFGRRQSGTGSKGERAATCGNWLEFCFGGLWLRSTLGFLAATDRVEANLGGTPSLTLFAWLRRGLDHSTSAEQTRLSGFLPVSHQLTVTPREKQHTGKQPTIRISYWLR